MIKDRNIDKAAGIFPGKIAGHGAGEIFYVCQEANAAYSWLDARVPAENLFTTITAALAATVTERNDYVLVWPDATDYDEGATLTMDKNNVHLICPAGLGGEYGAAMRAATIDPSSAAHAITITGRGCEVAGFWIRGYTEKICVYVNGNGNWIHHNDCAITNTTALAGGIYVSSSGSGAKIENNFVFTNAGSGTFLYGIYAHPSATRTQIKNNVITVSNASTCTNGIDTTAAGSMTGAAMFIVADNIVVEEPAHSTTSASTLSCGIRAGEAVACINNRIAIATEANGLIGGTANCTFVTNYEPTSGGTLLT